VATGALPPALTLNAAHLLFLLSSFPDLKSWLPLFRSVVLLRLLSSTCKHILTNNAALTKNGLTILAAPPPFDVSKYEKETDKKITDEEILKILELPLNKKAAKAKK